VRSRRSWGVDMSSSYCNQLWAEPQVNFDGRLLGCCVNTWGTFGQNVFDVGLARALVDWKLEYAKQMLRGLAPPRDDIPCATCGIYVDRAKAAQWMQRPPMHGSTILRFLRRRGMGRFAVWLDNRFERQLTPVMRRLGLLSPG